MKHPNKKNPQNASLEKTDLLKKIAELDDENKALKCLVGDILKMLEKKR